MERSPAHQEIWEKRLRRYEQAYFGELQVFLDRYSAIPEAFPAEMRKATRSLAVYCNDGIILVRYQADTSSFNLEVALDESIFDAARRLGAGDLRAKSPRARKWFQELRNLRVEIRLEGNPEPVVITPDWYSITASMGFLVPAWTVEQARYRASWEGLTYVAAHLLNVQIDEERDNAEDTAREAYGTYESVVEEFKELVTSINIEAPLQTFLTENPPLLTLEAARVWPQFKLGDDYITDFVPELGFQEYVLVEIEAPSRKLFTKNGDATADLNHAIQQVEDWLRWIETAASYAQAKLPGIVSPECWVVIGRRIEDPQLAAKWNRKKRTMSTTRIYLFTYDDLLDRAQRQLASLRKMEVS